MKILVYGAGAVGSLLGGFLARTGHDIALVGRDEHLSAIEKRGLRISGIWGEYNVKSFDMYRRIDEIPETKREFDLILFTVKSFDTEAGIADAARLVGPRTTVLSFQNGLTNVAAILKRVPINQFLAGRIITGVEITPGAVNVTVSADDLVVGALPGSAQVFAARQAVHLLSFARVPAREVPDIQSHIWLKAVYNCSLNAPCSVLGIAYGGMLETPERRATLARIVYECYAVAAKKGVRLDPASRDAYLDLLASKLIPLTATHFPSMLRDLGRGRRTEIDALNGAIAQYGAECGVATPENAALAAKIRDMEKRP